MRRPLLLSAAWLAVSASSAWAEVSRADLAHVGVATPPGAAEPLGLAFRDRQGRPTTLGQALGGETGLLVFQDYRCRTLCGPALAIVAAGIKDSGLQTGRNFRLVAIGLNPRETPADAAAMQADRLGGSKALVQGSAFLTGDARAISAATRAVGFGYAYDPATDQFTHPVAAFVLTPAGRVARVLPEVSLTGRDLEAAVLSARRGEVGELVDRLALLCHGLIPLDGRYDGAVQTGLQVAGGVTVLGIAAALGVMMRRRRTT